METEGVVAWDVRSRGEPRVNEAAREQVVNSPACRSYGLLELAKCHPPGARSLGGRRCPTGPLWGREEGGCPPVVALAEFISIGVPSFGECPANFLRLLWCQLGHIPGGTMLRQHLGD